MRVGEVIARYMIKHNWPAACVRDLLISEAIKDFYPDTHVLDVQAIGVAAMRRCPDIFTSNLTDAHDDLERPFEAREFWPRPEFIEKVKNQNED